MQVRFWGTRGSLAKPGPTTLHYGGNTSCVEIRADDGTLIMLDCGTGAHAFGQALMAGKSAARGHLLISHTHWDHIQGFPFFAPLYVPASEWDVYGPAGLGVQLENMLQGQQEYHYFPVTLDALAATIRFHDLTEGVFNIDGVQVTACYLNHPAVTLGYRIRAGHATVVYATDHEPHWPDPADAWSDAVTIHREDQRHLEFLASADLVIHDAQYRLSDFPAKAGWGHTPVERAVDYCLVAGVKQLALFHHDPLRTDEQVAQLVDSCRLRAANSRLHVFAAAEGEEIAIREGNHAASAAPAQEALLTKRAAPTDLGAVLIVEDEAELLNLMKTALEDDGLRVLDATNGETALRIAAAERPALILLDVMLPGMDGFEVCRRLRQHPDPAVRDVPIVLVTALDRTSNVQAGFQAGASDYVTKPFTLQYLRSRVGDWLFRRHDQALSNASRPPN